MYAGTWTFDATDITVPPIVDGHLWQTVQARLLAAGKRGLRRARHVYLLDEGLGRCGYCGSELSIRWSGTYGDTVYYTCPTHGCGLKWRQVKAVDREVWTRLSTELQCSHAVCE